MIGTRSIEKDVTRIEQDLQHQRAQEQARREEMKSELKSKLAQPEWLLAGFAGGALLGYLLTPPKGGRASDEDDEQIHHAEARSVSAHHAFWHKVLDHALVVLRTYLTALVAHHAIEKAEDRHDPPATGGEKLQ